MSAPHLSVLEGREHDPGEFFGEKGALRVEKLGNVVKRLGNLRVGSDGRLYRYVAGVYQADGDAFVRVTVRELLGPRVQRNHFGEVLAFVQADYATVTDEQPAELVNVANGLLEWRTGKLQPHSPAIVSTAQIPVGWNPEARCEAIESFLLEVLPPDAVDLVVEIIGYALLPANPLRIAVLFLGPGRNGKSVLLALIRALLGSRNVSAVPLQVLAENRFASAQLFGKLANVCGDLDARAVRQTDTFKMMTGGDAILAEHKNRDPFTFIPFALPIFSANEAPISSDQSEAWFDRWIVVPMEMRLEEKRIDPHLSAKLTCRSEIEGFLPLAVAGLRRLMERGHFEIPESVRRTGQEYREHLDSVAGFLSEACIFDPTVWTPRAELYIGYKSWCTKSGRCPVSAQKFHGRLRDPEYRDRIDKRKRGREGFAGIRLAGGPDGTP